MDKHMESQDGQDKEERALLAFSEDDSNIELPTQTWSSKVRYVTVLALLGIMLFAAVSSKAGPTFLHGGLQNTVQLNDESSASKFYLLKQTFKADRDLGDIKEFWKSWNNIPDEVMKQFADDGYHIPICMMLAKDGPFFHVVEQKVGNTNDAQKYLDKWMEDNTKVEMHNEMTPLAFAPVTPFFGADKGASSRRLSDDKAGFYLVEMTSDKDHADKYADDFDKAGGFDKWNQDAKDKGCHDHMCLAVKGGGLSYELMEAKPGVTSADIKDFVNKWVGANLHEEVGVRVWPIPNELNRGGAAGIGVKPYF